MNGSSAAARGPRARLQQAAGWLRFGAAAAFALFSSVVLVRTAPAAWEPVPVAPPRPVPGAAAPPSPSAEPQSVEPLVAPPAPSETPMAQSARQILIDLGPARSEVFVDGRRVGQTPFLGQVRCRPGREIKITVIPERGLPLEEKRICPP